jgi:hypothetical protein
VAGTKPHSGPIPYLVGPKAVHVQEKLVRERGVGSGERGTGSRDFISKFLGILTTMARRTYYRGL